MYQRPVRDDDFRAGAKRRWASSKHGTAPVRLLPSHFQPVRAPQASPDDAQQAKGLRLPILQQKVRAKVSPISKAPVPLGFFSSFWLSSSRCFFKGRGAESSCLLKSGTNDSTTVMFLIVTTRAASQPSKPTGPLSRYPSV